MHSKNDFDTKLQIMVESIRKWFESLSRYGGLATCFPGKILWMPSADIHETEGAYHVFLDMGGVDPATVEMVIEGNTLRLEGERPRCRVEDCTRIHQLEIDYGAFQRTFQFPLKLDADGTHSSYRNGLLEVILPKLVDLDSIQVYPSHPE